MRVTTVVSSLLPLLLCLSAPLALADIPEPNAEPNVEPLEQPQSAPPAKRPAAEPQTPSKAQDGQVPARGAGGPPAAKGPGPRGHGAAVSPSGDCDGKGCEGKKGDCDGKGCEGKTGGCDGKGCEGKKGGHHGKGHHGKGCDGSGCEGKKGGHHGPSCDGSGCEGKTGGHHGHKGGWKRFMPRIGVAAAADVGAEMGDGIGGHGAFDRTESGFAFDWLELGLLGRWGGVVVLDAAALATASEVMLDHAAIGVDHLPWNLAIRGGLLRSRVGYESARSPWAWAFPDQAPALTRVFGPLGHVFTGADLAFDIPAPWTLRPFFAAGMATGSGMRSFYGTADVKVDAVRDLHWQVGLENWIAAGPVDLSIEFSALLGPNDTGRANYSDVLAFGLAVVYPRTVAGPCARPEGVGVRVETEWYMRRRQVPGRNLADTSGFLSAEVSFAGDWAAGLRFDYAQALEASVLDARATDDLIRATLKVGYEPAEWVALDLVGALEKGGEHDDMGYSIQLAVRAGLIPEVTR